MDRSKFIGDGSLRDNELQIDALRDEFALAIAPKVVEALSPKGSYGNQGKWAPAQVIGKTVWAIADAIMIARKGTPQ